MPDAHLLRANSIFDLKQAPADAGNVFHITKNCVSVVMQRFYYTEATAIMLYEPEMPVATCKGVKQI